MKNLKNNKGITLSALIITIIVLVTIAGTAVYSGMDVYEDAKQEALVQELELIQNVVNNENSKIEIQSLNDKNNDGAYDYIYNLTWEIGKEIPSPILEDLEEKIGEGNGYRYFKSEDLKEIGITGANIPVLINFTTRDVILEKGFNGKYRLSEFNETTNYNSNVVIKIDDVSIPNGFVYLTGSKEEGLVIKNIADGNEFVWVPVDNTTEWSEPGINPNLQNITNNINNEYEKMKESVDTYKGFYVGRYETSWNGIKVSSKGNVNPLYQTKWIDGEPTTWYTFYIKQKDLYPDNESNKLGVVSGMIYDGQWNAIMNWMKDVPNNDSSITDNTMKFYTKNSIGMGWYSNNNADNPTHLTGVDLNGGKNKVFNIYDLAGNYFEWTQKAGSTTHRVYYGGYYGHSGEKWPVSSCGTDGIVDTKFNGDSSRLQLYIKVD